MPIPNIVDGWGHAYYFKLEPIERKVLTENVDRVVYKGTQDVPTIVKTEPLTDKSRGNVFVGYAARFR